MNIRQKFEAFRQKLAAAKLANDQKLAGATNPLSALYYRVKGGILVAAVIGLGVLVIVVPLIYGISTTVGNSLSFPGISGAQASTLSTLVNNGGSALQLTSLTETVVGAGIIILGIALYFRLR